MFDNTSNSEILFISLILFVITLGILYAIIQAATKSSSILKLHRMQVELLKEIALKGDVDPARVDEIIEEHNK